MSNDRVAASAVSGDQSINVSVGTSSPDAAVAVDSFVKRVDNLLTFPQTWLEFEREVNSDEWDIRRVGKVLKQDPTIVSRVLKIANAPIYGVSKKINTVEKAISTLGISSVRNLVLCASLDRIFISKGVSKDRNLEDVWRHAQKVANYAAAIAERIGFSPADLAYTAGLLHDIGLFVEISADTNLFAAILRHQEQSGLSFMDSEREFVGCSHDAIGAAMSRKWSFPEEFSMVSQFHHRPSEAPKEHQFLISLVHVADIAAGRDDEGLGRQIEVRDYDPESLRVLSMGDPCFDIEELIAEVDGCHSLIDYRG